MSTGYSACSTHTISDTDIGVVIKDEALVKDFIAKFNAYDFTDDETCDYDELATTISGENPGDIDTDRESYKELKQLWEKLSGKFKEQTGIPIYINYHDTEKGDIYDDVEGLYFNFYARDLFRPTDAYQKFMDKFGDDMVQNSHFVIFG
jgi:aryl-phospho-beta-D-glucosidase BglC (GH1 family)